MKFNFVPLGVGLLVAAAAIAFPEWHKREPFDRQGRHLVVSQVAVENNWAINHQIAVAEASAAILIGLGVSLLVSPRSNQLSENPR